MIRVRIEVSNGSQQVEVCEESELTYTDMAGQIKAAVANCEAIVLAAIGAKPR